MNTFELAKKAKLKIVEGLSDSVGYSLPELEAFERVVREDQIQKSIKALEDSWVLCKHGCVDVLRKKQNGNV
jgi:hypothetical protein